MSETIHENINEWNIENEEKLNEWKQHCVKYSLEHSKNSSHLKKKIKRIMYFTIILSGIASILSGIASYYNHDNIHLVISVSIINGIITSLNLYKNLENFEKSMKLHIESAKGYNEISMKITEHLLIEPNERIKYHIFEKNIILQMLSYDNENILLTINNKPHNTQHIIAENTKQITDVSTNIIPSPNKPIYIPQLTKNDSERFGLFLNRFQQDIQCKKYNDIEMNLATILDRNSSEEYNDTSTDSNETNAYFNHNYKCVDKDKSVHEHSFDYNQFSKKRYESHYDSPN
jgi:hypothetical protein